MYILSTKSGRTLECAHIAKGLMYNTLQIYTDKLTPVQAYEFFGNEEDISELTMVLSDSSGEPEETHIIKGYTEIYSVQKPILITGEGMIMIWLRRADNEE